MALLSDPKILAEIVEDEKLFIDKDSAISYICTQEVSPLAKHSKA